MWGVIQNVLIISILKLQKMHVHLISITAGMRGGHRAQFLEFRLFGGVMEYELPADCSHSHALGQWNCVNNVHPHWLSWSLAFLSANESLRTSMLLASISSLPHRYGRRECNLSSPKFLHCIVLFKVVGDHFSSCCFLIDTYLSQ